MRGARRQHARMQIIVHGPLPKSLAEPLLADAIHVWHVRRARDVGRTPLRRLLAAQLGVAADDVLLRNDAHGRPHLDPSLSATLDFNWSHSGEHALVALAHGIAPGIDIELHKPRVRALDLARRFFARDEADWLATLDGTTRDHAFLELWTAHEAVLKAIGRGIAFGLDRLAFRREQDGLVLQHIDGDAPSAWQVHALDVGNGALACLAWRGEPRRIRQFQLVDDA